MKDLRALCDKAIQLWDAAPAPTASLVERVSDALMESVKDQGSMTRAAILEVAAWLRENEAECQMGGDADATANLLEDEVNHALPPLKMTDFRALCAELADYLQGRKDLEYGWPGEDPEQDLLDRTRAALAQPEPQGTTQQHRAMPEQWENIEEYRNDGYDDGYGSCIIELRDRIAALEASAGIGQPVTAKTARELQLEQALADATWGLRYIEQSHGRLYGVGWDRVYETADRLLGLRSEENFND